MAIKKALISVWDKTGIIEFSKALSELGIKIISSGGTAKTLLQNKIDCIEISEVTGFPEILDGRVKTLNPKIHGGILARRDKKEHLNELKKFDIEPIDIVAVNLYPFEETISKISDYDEKNITEDVIENIDIGGVALLRAAAKNFNDVLVVCDPGDYKTIIEKIKSKSITKEFRLELAAKAFRHTAYYDALISGYFTKEKFPKECAIPLKKISPLRYGENPHQEATLYSKGVNVNKPYVINAKVLQGKELSYNNYLDLESAWRLIQEFNNTACAIIKHNNPCGCAEGKDILDAYLKALSCDPASAFGGIIAVNGEVDDKTAAEIAKLFTECIIAPSYSKAALDIFASKKNLRLLVQSNKSKTKPLFDIEYRAMSGGMLAQDKDNQLFKETKPATKKTPSKEEMESLKFAWIVCKHIKSNAIILVRGKQTVGIGAGQMSRIDSLNIANSKMEEVKHGLDEDKNPLVLASDAFFPFPDVVNEASKIGVKAIIQPGGSIKDEDSISAANNHGIAMVFTGMRHFRH
ncbi:MAG: bifunctional phosphoribosylaminoimidazolecarboxamide formyltransferase/IMP cyclohydrolase [Elusimicrobia bacterium]|nr:bifunctional phosphoribosylaminoimidazolecarboxamide formyltransferase/IMP cyclohydrolase [Elusimicrobiota bacterium]